jgi:hypothetical protein
MLEQAKIVAIQAAQTREAAALLSKMEATRDQLRVELQMARAGPTLQADTATATDTNTTTRNITLEQEKETEAVEVEGRNATLLAGEELAAAAAAVGGDQEQEQREEQGEQAVVGNEAMDELDELSPTEEDAERIAHAQSMEELQLQLQKVRSMEELQLQLQIAEVEKHQLQLENTAIMTKLEGLKSVVQDQSASRHDARVVAAREEFVQQSAAAVQQRSLALEETQISFESAQHAADQWAAERCVPVLARLDSHSTFAHRFRHTARTHGIRTGSIVSSSGLGAN